MQRLSFYCLLILCVTLWSFSSVISFIYQVNAGSNIIEICTSEGFVTISVAQGEEEPNNPEKPSCPFCAVASTAGSATLSAPLNAQLFLFDVKKGNEASFYDVVFSRSFQQGLDVPLRAPPIFS